jgi:protoporphyrinogen IX oxidase
VNWYLTFKALHIIALVAWFAGLFYIVRLFVYLRETFDRPPDEQAVLRPLLSLMAYRLWFGITWPAGIVALTFGSAMLPWFWPLAPWLQIKLALVVGLVGYHLACHRLHARLQAGEAVWSSTAFRMWNEVATLFLVAIVFLVVLKDVRSLGVATVGLGLFAAGLMAGVLVYRRLRERNDLTSKDQPPGR